MYDVEHPAYSKLAKIGREITSKVKPRAVVVFSAHWQGRGDTVLVNTAENTDLIYEYVFGSTFLVFDLLFDVIVGCPMVLTACLSASTASRAITIKRRTPIPVVEK